MGRDLLSDYLDDLVELSRTTEGRYLAITAGSILAATYLNHLGPGLLDGLQAGITYVQAKAPYLDPVHLGTEFFNGAQVFCRGAFDAAEAFLKHTSHALSVDLVNAVREASHTARADMIKASEVARTLFVDAAETVGGHLEEFANAATSAAARVVENGPKIAEYAFDILKGAVEAYGFYEVGKKIYNHWFQKNKEDVEAVAEGQAPQEAVNITVNVAMSGAELGESPQEMSDRISTSVSERIHDDLGGALKKWEASGRAIEIPLEGHASVKRNAKLLEGDLNLLNHFSQMSDHPVTHQAAPGGPPKSFGGSVSLSKLEHFKKTSREMAILRDFMLSHDGLIEGRTLDQLEDRHIPEEI